MSLSSMYWCVVSKYTSYLIMLMIVMQLQPISLRGACLLLFSIFLVSLAFYLPFYLSMMLFFPSYCLFSSSPLLCSL